MPKTPLDSPRRDTGPIETVVFDWGGTLSLWAEVEMEDMWRLAAGHVAAETGADPADVLARVVAVEERLWEQSVTGPEHASFRLVDILEEASSDVGVDLAAAVLEEAAAHHLDTWTPHISHDPDAVPVLEALSRLGCRVGLLSNTHWPSHWHEHFLERDGLVGLIDVRVYSSNEAHAKPHPSIFATTLERLGASAGTALMVGDRQFDDVLGAQRAGLRAAWKQTEHARDWPGVEPDYVVASLPEVVGIVEASR